MLTKETNWVFFTKYHMTRSHLCYYPDTHTVTGRQPNNYSTWTIKVVKEVANKYLKARQINNNSFRDYNSCGI